MTASGGPDDTRRRRLSGSGERAAALEAATRKFSQELTREADPVARASVLSAWGEASRLGGRPAEATELLEQALATLGESLPRKFFGIFGRGGGPVAPPAPAGTRPAAADARRLEVLSDALERLAAACAAAGDFEKSALARRQWLVQAARLGVDPRFARALGSEALAAAQAGEREPAAQHLDALAKLAAAAEAGGAPLAASIARRFEALALLETGRAMEARERANAAKRLGEAAGDVPAQLAATLALARISAFCGAPREAGDLADAARRLARTVQDLEAEDHADALAGAAHVLTGEMARGRRLIERARSRAIEAGAQDVEWTATYLAGVVAAAAGDWRSARAFADRLGTEPGPSFTRALPALLDGDACIAAIHAGGERRLALAEAMQLLEQASARVAKLVAAVEGLPALAARARRLAGMFAAERSDRSAIATLERALEEARRAAGPVETARTLLALGMAASRLERRDPLPLYREAEKIAAEAGALLFRERARALIEAAEQAAAERHQGGGGALGAGLEEGRERRGLASLLEVGRAVSSILELDPLLERIMDEIVGLLGAERGFVMLYDEPLPIDRPPPSGVKLTVRVARNLDRERISSAEFQVSRSVVAEVEKTRNPIVVSDASTDTRFESKASIMNLQLRSILCFPLKTTRSFLGTIYVDSSSPTHFFRERDADLTLPFVSQAAVAIENAFAYDRIRALYEETLSVARAREKVLNHLAHELKTPIAIVRGTLVVLAREAGMLPAAARALERGERNLNRLVEIQTAISDIYKARGAGLASDEPDEPVERIAVAPLLEAAVAKARAAAPTRELEIALRGGEGLEVESPRRPLETAIASLLQNAIENTPDEGKIELSAEPEEPGLVTIAVKDYGVGITAENRKHIFEGFYHTQDTESYSSRRPFEFNAGGKGLDLLRVRTFARRYGWEVGFESERCGFIPKDGDACPGRISQCLHCKTPEDCFKSGGSTFRITLPRARREPAPRV